MKTYSNLFHFKTVLFIFAFQNMSGQNNACRELNFSVKKRLLGLLRS